LINSPNTLYIDSAKIEIKRTKSSEYLKVVYDLTDSTSTYKKDLYTLLEINKLRYTIYDDKSQLRSHSDFESTLTNILLLSNDVKLHKHNTNELVLDLISYKYESTIVE
jgi:hypothetical protein